MFLLYLFQRFIMSFRKNYTDDEIRKYAAEVKSMAQLLKRLGLKSAGGNFANMKRKLQKLDVDCSHWTGQAWSKDERLKDWSDYKRASNAKKHLIAERGHSCEECKRGEWRGQPIALEVHHIDGDRTNNNGHNLQILCPNCHAFTDNYRGRKNKK